jgi:hypothetical protein
MVDGMCTTRERKDGRSMGFGFTEQYNPVSSVEYITSGAGADD